MPEQTQPTTQPRYVLRYDRLCTHRSPPLQGRRELLPIFRLLRMSYAQPCTPRHPLTQLQQFTIHQRAHARQIRTSRFSRNLPAPVHHALRQHFRALGLILVESAVADTIFTKGLPNAHKLLVLAAWAHSHTSGSSSPSTESQSSWGSLA